MTAPTVHSRNVYEIYREFSAVVISLLLVLPFFLRFCCFCCPFCSLCHWRLTKNKCEHDINNIRRFRFCTALTITKCNCFVVYIYFVINFFFFGRRCRRRRHRRRAEAIFFHIDIIKMF